ncbi:MAG: ABC transporter permease subunit [Eubacteriales bacterium]|nr:ABC transporter permease subunit [Eubacteriales bacterium]
MKRLSLKPGAARPGQRLRRENRELYLIMAPVLVMVFIFFYLPMFGVVIAFQDYTPGDPFFSLDGTSRWVGLRHFKALFSSIYFPRLLRNTVTLSVMNILCGFWVPIVFALLLNEILHLRYKKTVQTASYMPYFISMVVAAGMVISFIERDGLVNKLIGLFGGDPISFRTDPKWFPVIYTVTNIWKTFGWNSILYLSSMASIDPALYESARIAGASRFQQAIHITLPMIAPTIAIMLIFAVGDIMTSNTDLILLMYNSATMRTADVFGTYIYREGLLTGKTSLGTAIGLFASTVNFILVFIANKCSNKISGNGLF